MRWVVVAFVVLGVMAPAALAEPPDPCILLTTADASTVLGATPPKAHAKTLGLSRSCTYTVKTKTMTVQTLDVRTDAAFKKSVKATHGLIVPVIGVGADAYSANDTTLLLWKNGVEVTIKFVRVQPFVATQQSLAKTAAGRL
jgi:hypothetical protein